jgi:hypothetical protein
METWIAARIMRLATSNLPSERTMWGEAMQSEFESLPNGRLSWALGCLVAALNWRVRQDWLFLQVAGAASTLAWFGWFWPPPLMPWMSAHGLFHVALLAGPALACAGLTAWRPRCALGVALAMTCVPLAEAEFSFSVLMRQGFPAPFNVMNAPFVVGVSAMLAWCGLGAAAGRRLAGGLRSIRA